MKTTITALLIVLLVFGFKNVSLAQWPSNSATNVPVDVSTEDHWQNFWTRSATTTDGEGGAITCWYSGAAPYTIHASRIDKNGTVLWTTLVCAAIGTTPRYYSVIISDNAGGAIIAWSDWRNSTGDLDIYVARLDPNGNFVWGGGNGLKLVASGYGNDYYPQMCSDGAGGAIVVWNPNVSSPQIYARHVSANGTLSWGGVYGLAIVDVTGIIHSNPVVTEDGAGGAIITWEDWGTSGNDHNIYAKRVNASGVTVWGGATGTAVCDTILNQTAPSIVSDGSAGAIIAWLDGRNGGERVFAQKVDASGNMVWYKNGIIITGVSSETVRLASDGAGGAYITWTTGYGLSGSNGGPQDIYAQLVNSAGDTLWAANGISICSEPGTQWREDIISTTDGGAIIAWGDYRGPEIYSDIYIQKVDNTGALLWTPSTGVPVTTATCSQGAGYVAMASDGCNGVVLTWMDRRNSPGCAASHSDIYAQNVNSDGTLGGTSGTVGCAIIPPPAANFSSSDSSICAYDCIDFTDLSTNHPTSWSWTFPGGTPPTSNLQNPFVCYLDTNGGVFNVKLVVSNSGGSDSVTYNSFIYVSAAPPTPYLTRSGDTLKCSFDTSYSSYQWSQDGNDLPGETKSYLIISSGSNYNVQVSNSIGCSIAVGIIITGIDNYSVDQIFDIAPDPVKDKLSINSRQQSGDAYISIYNMLGEKIRNERVKMANNITIDVESLPAGIYIISLQRENSPVLKWMSKFVKR